MKISKEEIVKIANLADLNLKEEEIDQYTMNLQDILEFANVINNAPIEGLAETIGAVENSNVFREDEVVEFEDKQALLQNAKDIELNMYRLPKVIN